MTYRFDKARKLTIFFCSAFSLILWWVYANQITPILPFEQIFYYPVEPWEEVLCFLMAILPSFTLPTEATKPSHFISWMLYITVAAPASVVSPHILPSRSNVWPLVIGVVVAVAITPLVAYWKPLKLPRYNLSPFAFWMGAFCFSLIAFGSMYLSYGPPNTKISFSTAEALRSAFKEANKGVPVYVRYFFRWEGNVVAPLCVSVGFLKRKWWLVLVGCAIEQLIFMFTTLREFDLIPLMLIALALWQLYSKNHAGTRFIGGVTAMSIFFCALLFNNPRTLLSLAFFERFLMAGGPHTAMYYEYFTSHPPALMGVSLGRLFFEPPYDKDVGLVIGNAYYHMGSATTATNATAHYLADGFGNFLWPGLILAALAGMVLLWVIDSAYHKLDHRIAIMMSIMVALTINGTGLHTSILSGGILPMIFVGLIGGNVLAPIDTTSWRKRAQPSVPSSPELST